jgi:hypothetical protein
MELLEDDAGNVLADNGNGTDTLNGTVTIGLVTLTITTSNGYNGGNVPTIDPTRGTVVVPQKNTPAGSYTHRIPNSG